jgi:carotenoid cleavage dioxygenase-like enzyme
MTAAPAAVDFAPGLERAFADEPREGDVPVVAIEGELPPLAGTFTMGAPARFAAGSVRYRNWLDGDGMVIAARFDGRGVHVRQRFVATHKLVEERAAGTALYRTFGTRFAGDRLLAGASVASPVNLGAYPFAGALLAFGEQGQAWELDPDSLATRGPATFGGAINAATPFAGHPKLDPATGELVDFGVSFAPERPQLHLFRFAPDGTLALRARAPLPFPSSIHDFALARTCAVFHVGPYLLDLAALRGGATVLDALAWRPELGSRLLVLSRESGAPLAELPIGARYCLHLLNAWERDEDGVLVVDLVELDRPVYGDYGVLPDLFVDSPLARAVRYEVALDDRRPRVLARTESPTLGTADFPTFDRRRLARRTDEGWLLSVSRAAPEVVGRKFFDALLRVRWASGEVLARWQAPAGCWLAGEPAVAEAAGELWLIAPLWEPEPNLSTLAVLSAQAPSLAPVARVVLGGRVPLGFHSYWAPASEPARS